MINIYVPTKVRGFLEKLFNSNLIGVEFSWNEKKVYETNSKFKMILSKIIKSKLGNALGIIQRIKVKDCETIDINFSYNRFLKTNKSYVIYLENPTALFHYSLGRNETYIGKKRLNYNLNDKNLKEIICISDACYKTLHNFFEIPPNLKVTQVYPLIPKNNLITKEKILEKSNVNNLKCLYISSDFMLKGGNEIIKCFEMFSLEKQHIELSIVTKIKELDTNIKERIEKLENVKLLEFNQTNERLEIIYAESNILLNPTRQDSFPLVVLEAMKGGNAVITTDLYAINEMVEEGVNGYLTTPKYRFFDYDNMPNKEVWNDRTNTIYSNYTDERIVEFLYSKITELYSDRALLNYLSQNSFEKSNTGKFDTTYIKYRWQTLFKNIKNGGTFN